MYFGDSTRNKDLEVNENNKEYDASFFSNLLFDTGI